MLVILVFISMQWKCRKAASFRCRTILLRKPHNSIGHFGKLFEFTAKRYHKIRRSDERQIAFEGDLPVYRYNFKHCDDIITFFSVYINLLF